MNRCLTFLFFIFFFVQCAYGVNDHDLPDHASENQAWFADRDRSYVVDGCEPAVPSSSLTLAAFACQGYAFDSTDGKQFYIDQAAVTVTVPDSPTVFVAYHRSTNESVAGWIREGLTHYIFQANATKPLEPAGGLIFAQITVAGSVITKVDILAPRSPHDRGGIFVDDHGGDPTGVADSADAIEAAMNAVMGTLGARGMPVLFTCGGTYKVTRALVVPTLAGGAINKAVTFDSTKCGGFNKVRLIYTATDSSIMFDFSGATANLTMRNLSFIANNLSQPVDATTGTAIKLGQATHARLENLVIQFFNIGIELTGQQFYSKFDFVKLLENYSNGLKATNATINGTSFTRSQFSNTINGSGATFESPLTNVTFRNSYFEGNAVYGLELSNFTNALCDACYFEVNESYDIYAHNSFPHSPGKLSVTNSFFDPDMAQSHQRIRLESVGMYIANTVLYQTGLDEPPIFIAGAGALFPNVAINNWYETSKISSNEVGWDIQDDKHPRAGRLINGDPALSPLPRMSLGDKFVNQDPTTGAWAQGYTVILRGRGSNSADPTTLATTTIGSADVLLNLTSHSIAPGDVISIAGETFEGVGTALVLKAIVGPTITLDKTADNGVTGAAITKPVAKSRPSGIVTVMADLATSGSGLQDLVNTSLPASTLGPNGALKIRVMGTKTGGADNKLIILNFGTISVTINDTANDTNDWYGDIVIQNVNSESIQRVSNISHNGTVSNVEYVTGTVDTTVPVALQVRANASNAADTITMTMFTVELF